MKYQTKCVLVFDDGKDRKRAAEILMAAGMNGIESQLSRFNSNYELEFSSPEIMIEAMDLIDSKI